MMIDYEGEVDLEYRARMGDSLDCEFFYCIIVLDRLALK